MKNTYFLKVILSVFLFGNIVSAIGNSQNQDASLVELQKNQFNSVALLFKVKRKIDTYAVNCTGVIYDSTTILTASHCVQKCDWEDCDVMDAKEIKIMRGKGVKWGVITPKNYDTAKVHTVSKILANPYHKSTGRYYWSSDIAILKLKTALPKNSYTQLKIFPAREFSLDHEDDEIKLNPVSSIIAGFGLQEDEDYNQIGLGELNIRTTTGSNDAKSPIDFFLHGKDWQLYTKGRQSQFSVCKGDSGGPIFMKFHKSEFFDSGWYLMGVLSSAKFFKKHNNQGRVIESRCGLSEHTVIDYHMKWIDWLLGLF